MESYKSYDEMNKLMQYYFAVQDKLLAFAWSLFDNSLLNGKVLMFHHVTDDSNIIEPNCVCRINKFKETITQILEDGIEVVNPSTALSYIKNKHDKPFILITFDDVPFDALENAVPILRKYNLPYTFFISPSFMKKNKYLSEEDVKELANDPLCTIGAHTMTHPMLRKVNNAKEEIEQSKFILENIIGRKVEFLAYPYGKHSSISFKIRQYAKEAGFKAAFGTIPGIINRLSSMYLFYLPRIVI